MSVVALSDSVVDELRAILGSDYVLTNKSSLFNRGACRPPFQSIAGTNTLRTSPSCPKQPSRCPKS